MRTHRRILTVSAMVVIVVTAMSTTRSLAETRLGVKGGATFASYDVQGDFVDINNRNGFAVALDFEYSLSTAFRLSVEPTYVQKGGVVDFSGEFDFADNTQKWDYVVVPVGIKALTQLGPVQPFARVGFGVGFLVNNETEMKNGTSAGPLDIKDYDFTVEMGAGVEIPANERVAFTLEGRYAPGIISISPADASDTKTQTWLVLGGVSFRL